MIQCTEEVASEISTIFKSVYATESDTKDLRGATNDSFKRIFDILKIEKKDKAGKKAVKKAYKDWKEYNEDSVDPQSDAVAIFEMVKDK